MTSTTAPSAKHLHFAAVRIEARSEADTARARMNLLAAKGKTSGKAFRDAAEDYEFWTSKVAFAEAALTHDFAR